MDGTLPPKEQILRAAYRQLRYLSQENVKNDQNRTRSPFWFVLVLALIVIVFIASAFCVHGNWDGLCAPGCRPTCKPSSIQASAKGACSRVADCDWQTSSKTEWPDAASFLVDTRDEHFSEAESERQLQTIVDWGRYAQIFKYDVSEERLHLVAGEVTLIVSDRFYLASLTPCFVHIRFTHDTLFYGWAASFGPDIPTRSGEPLSTVRRWRFAV